MRKMNKGGVVTLIFFWAWWIMGLASLSENIGYYLHTAPGIAFVFCMFVLLPIALFVATLRFATRMIKVNDEE
jgi:hypothetical protein